MRGHYSLCFSACVQLEFYERFSWISGAKIPSSQPTNQPSKQNIPLPVFADWLYARALQQLAGLELNLGISPRWKVRVCSGLFWAYIFPWKCSGFLNLPYTWPILNVLISLRKSLGFTPKLLDGLLYISIIIFYPLRFLVWLAVFF